MNTRDGRLSHVVRLVLAASLSVSAPWVGLPSLHAQATGFLGAFGFMELTAVMFSEGDRTFGPGEVITVSGAVPFIPVVPFCPSVKPFGHEGRGELGRQFVDPFPTADLYVIQDTGRTPAEEAARIRDDPDSSLEDKAQAAVGVFKLEDVSGAYNRVVALSSGAFIEEPVAIAQPAGKLDTGRYDVVMDQCLDGYFDPLVDIVLGEGRGFAFEVVVPGNDLTPVNLHPLKTKAELYSRFLGGLPGLPNIPNLEVPGFCKGVEPLVKEVGEGRFKNLAGLAVLKCHDLAKHWEAIAADPPDPDFTEFAELGPIGYDLGTTETPLERAMSRVANALAEQAAVSKAFLTTLERFQGAQAADDHEYMTLQLEALDRLIHLLIGPGGSVLRFYAALENFDLALEDDPIGQGPAAQALRATFPELRRATGALFEPLGPTMPRRIVNGQDVLVPVGLQAWIGVYRGQFANVGLTGIPQVRAARGLPPLVFQHPVATTTGPYTAPPGDTITFDASGSRDPNGDSLTFAWDLDSDGSFDDATTSTIPHSFDQAGTRLVGVKVSDSAGHTGVRYVLLRVGDLTVQDMVVCCGQGRFLRVTPAGAITPFGAPQFSGNVWDLAVEPNGEIVVVDQAALRRFDANGQLLKVITNAQVQQLAGLVSVPEFRDLVIDGRGDLLVVTNHTTAAPREVLVRVAPDGSRASAIMDRLPGYLYGGRGIEFDPDGNLVVVGGDGDGANGGAVAVDPVTGALRETIPAVNLLVGGAPVLQGQPGGPLVVDGRGHYIWGFGSQVNGSLHVWRAPIPAVLLPYQGPFGPAIGLDVVPLLTHIGDFGNQIFYNDLDLDSGGDLLVTGAAFNLGSGVWRVTPEAEVFRIADFRPHGNPNPSALGVVREVREVRAKDITPAPGVHLSRLAVGQDACPGSAEVTVRVSNPGTAALPDPVRVLVFDGDPTTGGTFIGSALTQAPLAPGAFQDVAVPWPSPSPALHHVFALALGANMPSTTYMVCVPDFFTDTDETPPAVTAALTPLPNANGWNRSSVTVVLTAEDELDGSGVKEIRYTLAGAHTDQAAAPGSTTSIPLSAEGATTVSFYAVDESGNQGSPQTLLVQIDKTPPEVSAHRSPAANAAGWNNGDVTISFTCTDALSGVDECTSPQIFMAEGAGQSLAGTATDLAGNMGSAMVGGINIDKTAPTVAGTRNPLPNAAGWNNADVTVSFTCSDQLSGVAECGPSSQPVTTEGAGQSRTGSAVDLAGNAASTTVGEINIDKTAPTIAGSRTPEPNAAGWNTTNITVTFICTDGLSGVASCGPSPQVVTTEGVGQSRTGSAGDKAGNMATAIIGGINIDRTAPVVSCAASPVVLWPPNHKMVAITVGVTVADSLSAGSSFKLVSATSNEPDNGLGDGDTVNDIQAFEVGTADTSGLLRAERSGLGTGRTYSLRYRGTDQAENGAFCEATVTVPHHQ